MDVRIPLLVPSEFGAVNGLHFTGLSETLRPVKCGTFDAYFLVVG